MVLFELPYSQVKEVEVEFYGLRFEDSKIFFRKKYGTYPRSAHVLIYYLHPRVQICICYLGVQCVFNCKYIFYVACRYDVSKL